MITLLWLLPALAILAVCSVAWDLYTVYHLRLAKEHDRILYRFCRVRDSIAQLAVEGKLAEDSNIFKFFYSQNASIIHSHRDAGLCFSDLLKQVDREVALSARSKESDLLQEIRQSDEEVHKLVDTYNDALLDAIITSLPMILLDRIIRQPEAFVRTISTWQIVPAWKRQVISFWQHLRDSILESRQDARTSNSALTPNAL